MKLRRMIRGLLLLGILLALALPARAEAIRLGQGFGVGAVL